MTFWIAAQCFNQLRHCVPRSGTELHDISERSADTDFLTQIDMNCRIGTLQTNLPQYGDDSEPAKNDKDNEDRDRSSKNAVVNEEGEI